MSASLLRGRFAPTPSGRMHLGNLSALLIAWLEARSAGGEFILRIEDLDRQRCKPEYTQTLLRDLEKLGFDYDGEPVFQSKRDDYYREVLEHLSKVAELYECFCTRAELHSSPPAVDPDSNAPHADSPAAVYSGRCRHLSEEEKTLKRSMRNPAIRIAVPDKQISFTDVSLGSFTENLTVSCGDFILRRSDGGWAYQLAVVADDIAQGVTQIVRGRDLVSSSARQIWLYELLGGTVPQYMHTPLLLAPDGRRLSKREHSLELGELLQRMSPSEVIGTLANLLGLIPSPEPITPHELIPLYRRENIVAGDVIVPEPLF